MTSNNTGAEFDVVVIGGGPGGYVAACAAADEGLSTLVIEEAAVPGGVCLREGCIPSKALLHVAQIMNEAKDAAKLGVSYDAPKVNLDKVRAWKKGVVRRLSLGVKSLFTDRSVELVRGHAVFESDTCLRINGEAPRSVTFKHCIIASGSVAAMLPDAILPREVCWDAADALELHEIPERLLVIGGGYIGIELSQVYSSFGSKVTVVEALPEIMTGADPELVKPLRSRLRKQFKAIHTSAQLKEARKSGDAISVTFVAKEKERVEDYDRVLVSIGRRPNTKSLDIEEAGVKLDDRGFIEVDGARRTNVPHIFAIGDVTGNPMLAHKAMREARVAVDVIMGRETAFEPACIPAVVYSDPEVAWCGVTEPEAQEQGLDVRVTSFPWVASGRAVAMSRTDGITKMVFDPKTHRVLGVGICGAHAGDLIGEAVLAMEMGAKAEDIATAIHPHPATSETLMEAAEAAFGKATHGSH